MKLFLIRHGRTAGNDARRYVGATDESLSEQGQAMCAAVMLPAVERVYVSSMRRCLQTIQLIYPMHEAVICDELREYDFGAFENKTHAELETVSDYRDWIAASGQATPPNGEDWQEFRERCCAAFIAAVDKAAKDKIDSAAIVTHGGVIMAILERFGLPQSGFYNWQADNLDGWELRIEAEAWLLQRRLEAVARMQKESADV